MWFKIGFDELKKYVSAFENANVSANYITETDYALE